MCFLFFCFFCCFRLLLLSFVQLPELFRNMSGKTVRPKKPYLASRYIDNGKIVFCFLGLWSFRKCPGTRICSRTIVEAERNYQKMKKHKKNPRVSGQALSPGTKVFFCGFSFRFCKSKSRTTTMFFCLFEDTLTWDMLFVFIFTIDSLPKFWLKKNGLLLKGK